MPASICDPVSSALRLSLAGDENANSNLLDSRIYSSAKTVLLSKIEFEESGDYQSNVLDGLKSKYTVIRPKKGVIEPKTLKKENSTSSQSSNISKIVTDGLPKPKRVLFPIERVELGWQGAWSAGAGMQNVGNTCYLNSTLQALFHVPAFANWLVSESNHADKCNQQDSCVICGMRATLMATQKSGGSPIKPWQVYSKLRLICRHLTPGRQEDAHEFLRYLVEAMEKCFLSRFPYADKLDQYSKETTPMNQILGGYLRSTVRCLACQHLSTTYQHFQDLLLDIRKHSTLDEALESFFSRERLEDLGYKCEACNKKVSATKQFFIERAPMVLCIALKRFSLVGGKLSKHIQFRKKICLNKYIYNKQSQQQLSYKLVGMVTHLGPSQNCGHYTAIGQAPNTNYYQFDDSCVRPLPLSTVLGTNAYIMFYEKDNSTEESQSSASTSSTVYGPQLPNGFINKEKPAIKLTFYDRKISSTDSNNSLNLNTKPIILNSTLTKSSDSHNTAVEPWVVKQNGDIEKVYTSEGTSEKRPNDDRKINFIIKRQNDENGLKPRVIKCDSDLRCIITNKQSKQIKSPLEKLEEQMNKNEDNKNHNNGVQNGQSSKLVPYDSESSGDEKNDRDRVKREDYLLKANGDPQPSRCESPKGIVTTKSMHHVWTVSNEKNIPQLSPSLNGVANVRLKEKEKDKSPNTSVSSLSPLSSESPPRATTAPPLLSSHETTRALLTMSHRGYGAPVHSWNGTNSHMQREVLDERREDRKRAHESVDDMDRGHVKKVKKFHHYNRFNNDRNRYNPFQEKQNKPHWGGNFKYRGDRRPQHFNNKHHNKYKRFNRYNNNNNGHHYSRHH